MIDDIHAQMQKRLDTIRHAGKKEVGEKLKPEFHGEKRSRTQVEDEYKRKQRWIAREQKRWHSTEQTGGTSKDE